MSADLQALALTIAIFAGDYTNAEQQFARAVARFETFYGRGWKGAGEGSHNWGAVQAGPGWSGPFFVQTDTHENGEKYQARFRVYPNDTEGARDAARILLKPNVREALRRGDGLAAVEAQRANGYFEAPLPLYQAKIRENYARMIAATGEEPLLSFDEGAGVAKGFGIGAALFVGAIALPFGLAYLQRPRVAVKGKVTK